MYRHGLIGNCQLSALVSEGGAVEWLCLPRPDSAPVFGRLLDPDGGEFRIELVDGNEGRDTTRTQRYIENTAVLVTEHQGRGEALRITDFCPRFPQYGRMYRPLMLLRVVEPVSRSPLLRVRCRPVSGWEKRPLAAERGSSHLRYASGDGVLRLVTNMPLTYLDSEQPFVLAEKLYFGLTWGVGIEDDLARVTNEFLAKTLEYWRTWVKHCSIPSLFQRQTIRSALTLKLHCYEDTGAILAALTTSLPEEPGLSRNWDYRYCWLRDAYFALTAFYSLSHFEELEAFLQFLLNIALGVDGPKPRLHPVYSLNGALPLPERTHDAWAGHLGSRPVRSNNQAAEHVQNDAYGEMILTLAPIFLDERFQSLRTREHEALLAHCAALCAENLARPDAGIWEVRDRWQEHSFSNLMCWAGLERVERIRRLGFLSDLTAELPRARAEAAVLSAVRDGSLRNGPADESFDASLALLPILRFPDRALGRATVAAILDELAAGRGGARPAYFYRYRRADDLGEPRSAFLACSFWLIQALALLGQGEAARDMMEVALGAANGLGLLSEHYDTDRHRQLGNFPQAYSHVGQINAAFALSPPWHEVL